MRAVLWDMDGTVLDSENAHAAAFNDVLAELDLSVSNSFHHDVLGASEDMVHEALVNETGVALTLKVWCELKWQSFQRHADLIVRREPNASLVIDLHERGVPMALVSNSTLDEIGFCLSTTDMTKYLPVCVGRADVVKGKPAPDSYRMAAQRLRRKPEDCLVVEDSPTGAQAGLAAGMSVLFHPETDRVTAPAGAVALAPADSPASMIKRFLTIGDVIGPTVGRS